MKKFLIIFSILICSILLFINFYQYLFVFEVNYKTKEKLFNECSQEISTNGIPMTVKEWQAQSHSIKITDPLYRISAIEMKNRGYEPDQKLLELAVSLGDLIDIKHQKSFYAELSVLGVQGTYFAYYGDNGNLLFFEKYLGTVTGCCRYNNQGKLIEASYLDDELHYTFTSKGHLMLRCYKGFCEKDLIRYKKPKL